MTDDPMDSPPVDYGSDRYDYAEVIGPQGAWPDAGWAMAVLEEPCSDCRANVFFKYTGDRPPGPEASKRENWHVVTAHDETCPSPENQALL